MKFETIMITNRFEMRENFLKKCSYLYIYIMIFFSEFFCDDLWFLDSLMLPSNDSHLCTGWGPTPNPLHIEKFLVNHDMKRKK